MDRNTKVAGLNRLLKKVNCHAERSESICCFLLKTSKSRSLAAARDDIGGAFSAAC
jgi:hypothetical protein